MMPCRFADEHPLLLEPAASILKIGAEGFSETLVSINKTTHHRTAELSNICSHELHISVKKLFFSTTYLDRVGHDGGYTNGLGVQVNRSRHF
jgi:hypothetical protein